MSLNHFIPTIWSENLLQSLNQNYVGVANCIRDYEGEIKEKGSSVKFCGVTGLSIKDYADNEDMEGPQELNAYYSELIINQAKYFNFQIDDVDRAQASPRMMDSAIRVAANELAKQADKYVFSVATSGTNEVQFENVTESNVLDGVMRARQFLYTKGVMDNTEVVLEVSPYIASLLYKAKLSLCTNNHEILENGCIGKIAGCKVFVSNHLPDGRIYESDYYDCVMRTKRAVAFAEQLSEIVAYRPEKRFADAVKGLHLYGAKILYPNELVRLRLITPEIIYEE